MRHASVQFGQIRPILASLSDSGVDVCRILRGRGLKGGLDDIPDDLPIVVTDYFRLQRDIAFALDDLTAQFSSRKLTYKTGQFVVAQLQQATNLNGAMESLVEHFNMMHGGAYNSVRRSENSVSLVVDDRAFPYRFQGDASLIHFIGDCLLIKTHCLLDSLSNGVASDAIRRVRLTRDRTAGGGGQNRFWDVPIEFGKPVYELVYDFDLACRPLRVTERVDLSMDGLFTRVINHLNNHLPEREGRSTTARTLDLVGESLSQSQVAARLEMSTATLRRRLEEEGSSFRDLVNQSRFERATSLIQNGYSISQVTEELGYSDIRAFNRAFKQWQGETPASFAKNLKSS